MRESNAQLTADALIKAFSSVFTRQKAIRAAIIMADENAKISGELMFFVRAKNLDIDHTKPLLQRIPIVNMKVAPYWRRVKELLEEMVK